MNPMKSILEFLKLAPRYLVSVAIFCAFLLFSPKEFLEKIGAFDFAENYRTWIGGAFLGSLCIWIVSIGSGGVSIIKSWNFKRNTKNKITKRLHNLTEAEKQILRFYIAKQTKSNTLRIDDGVVKGLESSYIIYQSAGLGNMLEGFAHNISEVAWDYLNKKPDLLIGNTDTYRTDTRSRY